jgi:hypothetical protein
VEEERLVYREELTAIIIALADLSVNVGLIRKLLEDELGEAEEDDA